MGGGRLRDQKPPLHKMPEDFEGYEQWLDEMYDEAEVNLARERFEREYEETAKMLAGGLI